MSYLHDEQRGRAGAARRGPRPEVMAVRRLRARRLHVFPDRHGKDERRRPLGMASRCPRQVAGYDGHSGA